jgi:hypothetical protein
MWGLHLIEDRIRYPLCMHECHGAPIIRPIVPSMITMGCKLVRIAVVIAEMIDQRLAATYNTTSMFKSQIAEIHRCSRVSGSLRVSRNGIDEKSCCVTEVKKQRGSRKPGEVATKADDVDSGFESTVMRSTGVAGLEY